jgi:C4-type Zn-finger protein
MSLTDSIQQDRHIVVAVDPALRTIRIKGAADACTDLSCSEQTLVVSDDAGVRTDLAALNAGDIVKLEGPLDRPHRIVVVRRVWDELSSPEW